MIKLKKRGLLIVVSGPSGAGKDTVCNDVALNNPNVWISISCTSRSIRNGEKEVYAKANARTGQAETGTIALKNDLTVLEKQRKDFKSGDIDRFTIVIWIEGDDPDCVDALIGGMMKMHMDITEEHIKQE